MTGDMIAEILSRPFGDDKPIVIQEVTVTHIDGTTLPKKFTGRTVFQLNPKIKFSINFDNFPIYLLDGRRNPTFHIKTDNGIETGGILQYSLNDLFHSESSIEASFIPKFLPMLVISPDTKIMSTKFGVINFVKFYGRNDQWIAFEGNDHRVGSFEAKWNGYRIEVTERLGFSEKGTKQKPTTDYDITHGGTIERLDGKPYSVSDAEDILRRLRVYLSFVRGKFCSFAPVVAICESNRESAFRWGATYLDPWQPGRETWLPVTTGGDILTQLLPEFFGLYGDSNWKDTVSMAVDWQVNGNNSAAHVATILYQAALEAISSKITNKAETAKWLRSSMKQLGIDTNIPNSYGNLRNFSDVEIRAKKANSKYPYIGDGPEAIVQIRNDLVHSGKNYPTPSMELQIEAMQLSRWYIEIMLLKKLQYSGKYFDRIDQNFKSLN